MKIKKLNDHIIRLFGKNIGWKILSLILAVFLWFIVMNIINPTETRTYITNLSLLNKEKLAANDFVILNEQTLEQTKVEIKVRGTRAALDELNKKQNRENITASIDLQQFDVLYAQDVTEPVNVTVTPSLPSGLYSYTYQISGYVPSVVSVQLDNVSSISKKIEIEQLGTTAVGYVSGQPVVTPEYLNITGPESEIEKIAAIKVSVDLNNAVNSIDVTASPVIYDSDGNEMSGFVLDSEKVNIKISVNRQGQIHIAPPTLSGEPADGYRVTGIDYNPKAIEVVSDSGSVQKISSIELPAVNVDGIMENKTVMFDIRPYLTDTGLSLKNSRENEVSVAVSVEESVELVLNIPFSQISISGYDDKYNIETEESLKIQLRGLSADIENINGENINGSIDLSGLLEGEHLVPVSFEMPEGIEVLNKPTTKLIITSAEETTAEETTLETTTLEDEDVFAASEAESESDENNQETTLENETETETETESEH